MKIRTIDLGERPVVLVPHGRRDRPCVPPALQGIRSRYGLYRIRIERRPDTLGRQDDDETQHQCRRTSRCHPNLRERYRNHGRSGAYRRTARPDILDLNFGCPVKRVAGKGAGAGMLQNIPKMLEITRSVVNAVQIPVTVKTRLGWDENHKVIVELAEQLQDCGIEALTIHGRTRSQMYTGEADWTLIGEVKNNPRMRIPIIGNGDITTPQRAKECFDRYGVDAIMIGTVPVSDGTVDIQGSKTLPGNGRRASFPLFPVETGRIAPGDTGQHQLARRAPGHPSREAPLSGFSFIQRHPQFPRHPHRHAPCRNARRALRDTGPHRNDIGENARYVLIQILNTEAQRHREIIT